MSFLVMSRLVSSRLFSRWVSAGNTVQKAGRHSPAAGSFPRLSRAPLPPERRLTTLETMYADYLGDYCFDYSEMHISDESSWLKNKYMQVRCLETTCFLSSPQPTFSPRSSNYCLIPVPSRRRRRR
ncbi:hypothetical protein GGR50DRAFT_684545 [Xylaria sp. CBS 124048]|nr:hypothetical protein GGR50DRAFT_684545 [Xylaria sp. CBS 124048]